MVCLFAANTLGAQWRTETFELVGGWNAVYLHIDPSHASLGEIVGNDSSNPIEEIWLWMPAAGTMQFIESPQEPSAGGTQWLRWDRYWGGSSPLQRLAPNAAYLVRVRSDVGAYTWTLKGKPVAPHVSWTSSGLNFIGIPTPRTNPPTWGTFLGPSRTLHNEAEIYHYPGGPFDDENPARLWPTLLRQTPLNRGEAYWVRADEYNRYFGPLAIDLQGRGEVRFGALAGQHRIRLRNPIDQPVTVSARLISSESPPPGERPIAGNVPLIWRGELDMSDLTYDFGRFEDGPAEWTLQPSGQPGSEAEVVLGLDRSAMTGEAGDLFAGILEVTDSQGMLAIDLPVSAEVASTTGLWVGNALVAEVGHQLVTYAETESGALVEDENGGYVVESVDESFGPVARPFPLRLILHDDGENGATLMQRIYFGPLDEDNVGLARRESALDSTLLSAARRISAAHLPWTEENRSWTFNGRLHEAAEIAVTVPLAHDDNPSNPFLHTYHPDHDNFDARFEQPLPQGAESYGITRRISLRVEPPAGHFADIVAGGGILSGTYEETVTLHGAGNATREYRVRGGFALNRIIDIATLSD